MHLSRFPWAHWVLTDPPRATLLWKRLVLKYRCHDSNSYSLVMGRSWIFNVTREEQVCVQCCVCALGWVNAEHEFTRVDYGSPYLAVCHVTFTITHNVWECMRMFWSNVWFWDKLRAFNLKSSERHSKESVDSFVEDKTQRLFAFTKLGRITV